MGTDTSLKVRFCAECLGPSWDDALGAVSAALSARGLSDKVSLAASEQLEPCAKPTTMVLQMNGGASYVFAGVDPEADAQDIAATCATYLDHADGWIEDARPCGRLRFCLTVRIPA